jgi:hypothetical protein
VSLDRVSKSNDRHSKHSTGPRTTARKARASRNAFRHGLATSVLDDGVLSVEVERLAHALIGTDGGRSLLRYARFIAEAEIDLRRIRVIRLGMIDALEEALGADIAKMGTMEPKHDHSYQEYGISGSRSP